MRKVLYSKGKTPNELMEKVEAVYREAAEKGLKIVNTQYIYERFSWGAFIEYEINVKK